MPRESMEFDVVIVGAGPAGLSAACKLMQLAKEQAKEISVVILEKGSEVGAHILSGAILEPRALEELFENWKSLNAPLTTSVTRDNIYYYTSATKAIKVPHALAPISMHNLGNYLISLGIFCRWLAEQAEALGVEIFPGFAATEILYHPDGSVKGVATGDMGIAKDGTQKSSFEEGMELHAKTTLFTEGSRGQLGKQLINKFKLDQKSDTQHYGLGIKELWEITPEHFEPGLVIHGAGWPLCESGSTGGSFLYHLENNTIAVGLITDLSYSNPHVSPFEEFQRFKKHPSVAKTLSNAKRIAYGARAITKGGMHALPEMTMPGALLLGCDAGTLNFSKIKGTHTAMKSGMLAAESIVNEVDFQTLYKTSWLYDELYCSRNFGSAIHKFGTLMGGAYNWFDQTFFNGKMPINIKDPTADFQTLKTKDRATVIHYPKPDGQLSFDRLSSVFLSSTNHEEDQPCHLQLINADIPMNVNLEQWDEPAQRYCPAGVYEVIETNGKKVNAILD